MEFRVRGMGWGWIGRVGYRGVLGGRGRGGSWRGWRRGKLSDGGVVRVWC